MNEYKQEKKKKIEDEDEDNVVVARGKILRTDASPRVVKPRYTTVGSWQREREANHW